MYDLEGLNSPQKVSTYAILQMAIESLTMCTLFLKGLVSTNVQLTEQIFL